ncbi:MAG: transporter substrate-binding domain-containing protein [Clostridiales bacterium]|nr:transporter substrate-binding domain-containing protein [Clostridiales bacterium]
MKKFLTLLLCAAMCLSLLAGCGSSSDSGTESADTESAGAESASEDSTEAAVDTDSEWAEISEKGSMTIGMTLFAPMNYYNDDNEFVGFDTELAQAVGEKLGITIDFVEINWDSKEIELNSKNIDCIWNGMCSTAERQETMTLSEPYLYNSQAMVMMADREEEIMADVSGLTVTAEQGSTGEGKLQGTIEDDETVEVSAAEYFADVNYVASDSMAKAIMEVKAGTADVALVDSVAAFGMVGPDTDYADLVVNVDNNFGLQEYVIGFRKGSDLEEKVSEAIDELYADGTVDELAEKYNLTDALIAR